MLGPVLALGIPALLGIIGFIYCKIVMEGPKAPIVVVDRRTLRLAQRRIKQAIDRGDVVRAYAGLTAQICWLSAQLGSGPQRRRLGYARLIEQAELAKEQLADRVGLPGYTL